MLSFILTAVLTVCSPTKILSEKPLDDYDKKTLEHARKRCGELYPNSPCVKVFIVYKPRTYGVVCGK